MNRKLKTCLILAAVMAVCSGAQSQTDAQKQEKQESAAEQIKRATEKMNQKQTYQLAYKLKKGDELRWDFQQTASTKVQMAGEMEESMSKSENTKLWKVANVDSLGNMTFVQSIEDINMWQQVGDADPVTYNSKVDKEVPVDYEGIAANVGKPLIVFTIAPNGTVIDRKSNIRDFKFGAATVTVPLPEEAIPVGYKWNTPTVLKATDEKGQSRKLKARILYELVKVQGKNAYISFRTQILTPFKSEKMKSTLMQQMTDGYLVFDMENGHPIIKQVEWDEKAQGFEGSDSYLKYVAQMTEKFIDPSVKKTDHDTSSLAPMKPDSVSKQVELKTRDGKPVMRK